MVMRVFIMFGFFLITISSSMLCKIYYTGKENVILTGGFESKNSFISYVTINGSHYIVKQKKKSTKKIAFVRDALAAYIAQDLGVAHEVQIVSAIDDIAGKMYRDVPATLHTRADGKMVSDLRGNKYFDLALKQRSPEEDPLANRWLTETIIHQMTWHKQLPIIIALDLFISNTDRHRGNLFYDEKTDRFCAIDMDNIYRRDLPALACEKLDLMVNVYQKKFTQEEIKALKSVRDTLQLLLKKHAPAKTIAQLHLFAKQAGYSNMEIMNGKNKSKKIASHEEMIVQSYMSAQKLVVVLDKIINSFYN